MITHQEALEAARAAYQSAIPVRPWRADGGETDAPIRAAIRAYLTTLAPADNGLVERVARAWASIDGKADRFEQGKAWVGKQSDSQDGGAYEGYMAEAQELLKRSGLAAVITAQAAENAELRERIDFYVKSQAAAAEEIEREHKANVALTAEIERLKAELAREAKLATEYAADRNEAEARLSALEALLDKAVEGQVESLIQIAGTLSGYFIRQGVADADFVNVCNGDLRRVWQWLKDNGCDPLADRSTLAAIQEARHHD